MAAAVSGAEAPVDGASAVDLSFGRDECFGEISGLSSIARRTGRARRRIADLRRAVESASALEFLDVTKAKVGLKDEGRGFLVTDVTVTVQSPLCPSRASSRTLCTVLSDC